MELQTNENATYEHVAQNFETINYDPSENSGNILLHNSCDLDLHFLTPKFKTLTYHTPYPKNFKVS